jgi:hypothetical protein
MKKSMFLKAVLALTFMAAASFAVPSNAEAGLFKHCKKTYSCCYTYCPPVYCPPPVCYTPPVYCPPPVCYTYCYPTYYKCR